MRIAMQSAAETCFETSVEVCAASRAVRLCYPENMFSDAYVIGCAYFTVAVNVALYHDSIRFAFYRNLRAGSGNGQPAVVIKPPVQVTAALAGG